MVDDKLFEAEREHFAEMVHCFLVGERTLGGMQEVTDVVLQLFGQVHVLHACVSQIKLILKNSTCSIHRLENG